MLAAIARMPVTHFESALKKEAARLGAFDVETIQLPSVKEASSKVERPSTTSDVESKCLKAVDYKGCMEYNSK